MRLRTLFFRDLAYLARSHVAVALGASVATAVLTGALLVGDSLRGSLRAAALDPLGRVESAVQAPRSFRQQLGADCDTELDAARVVGVFAVRGSVRHATTHATVSRVNVLGVDSGFWSLGSRLHDARPLEAGGLTVVLNQTLADDLGARVEDDVLLRFGRPADISPETLLGRRDETVAAVRLRVVAIVPADGLGAFALRPQPGVPRTAYVPLETLQRALHQSNRVNTLLSDAAPDELGAALRRRVALEDLGLRARWDDVHEYIALESESFLLPPPAETAARAAAAELSMPAAGALAYLANGIRAEGAAGAEVPYSTVVAVEPSPALLNRMEFVEAPPFAATAPADVAPLARGRIVLNEWTATALGSQPGDNIALTYYVLGPAGRLYTETTRFRLQAAVRLRGAAADPGFVPNYAGITDTTSLTDWRLPFPIDLTRIGDRDEAYWKQYRTTPKAFIVLSEGQELWAGEAERFGRLTSLRVYPATDAPGEADGLTALRERFERALLLRCDPTQFGFRVAALRARALQASQGATDFAGLFLAFSFFLIVAAALLVALLFRLAVERRSRDIGLLLAVGHTPGRVLRLLAAEGAVVVFMGAVVGVIAARGYTSLMLRGLEAGWAGMVQIPSLSIHGAAVSYVVGFVAGVSVALAAVLGALRGLARRSPRALLVGAWSPPTGCGASPDGPRDRGARVLAYAAALGAAVLILAALLTSRIPITLAFFGGGAGLLVAGLAALAHRLQREPVASAAMVGPLAILRLAARNAHRHVGRSLLTAGLLACATFVVVAVEALRVDTALDPQDRRSGTGGFALLAEAQVPITHDLNTTTGRDEVGLGDLSTTAAHEPTVAFTPLRLHDGDEASCLNAYAPVEPRILGAPDALLERGAFAFAGSQAESEAERMNPWLLLRDSLPDDAIPAIADEASVRWQLHLKLGDELSVTDERGRVARLRLVALVRDSILQGAVIVSESNFIRLFPATTGYRFYLIDAPPNDVAHVRVLLERGLEDFGVAVQSATCRLADLHTVQNGYLSAFQSLGGLGLLLGTIGLAAVLLRNVWERRSELALLCTFGFSRARLITLVLGENALLTLAGLLIGLLSAGIVVAPHLTARPGVFHAGRLVLMLLSVFLVGLLAGTAALAPTFRRSLVSALRAE